MQKNIAYIFSSQLILMPFIFLKRLSTDSDIASVTDFVPTKSMLAKIKLYSPELNARPILSG